MGRRPNIDPTIIKDGFTAHPYSSRPDEYSTFCPHAEPVGMDGRNDWFRWHCRECEQKYISRRKEKSMARYQCTECDAWHFVYKGFFSLPSRSKNGTATAPLRPSEVAGVLCRVKLAYVSNGEVYSESEDWHYSTEGRLEEKCESDSWKVVEPIEVVEA